MTGIERLQKTGIIRIGTAQRGFTYKRADGTRVSASDIARIQKLRVPPAWIEVAINPSPKGKLQVVGRDNAGRWQDRKSTRLNSSHDQISYAVFCLKKKKNDNIEEVLQALLVIVVSELSTR